MGYDSRSAGGTRAPCPHPMAPVRISAAARAFLAAHIHSIMQLELLLLVHRDPATAWSAQDASRELRSPVGWVEAQLVDFAGQGLLRFDGGDPGTFRYDRDARQTAAIDELARLYPGRRTSIIKLIFSPPTRDVQSFSDAFRIRDDED